MIAQARVPIQDRTLKAVYQLQLRSRSEQALGPVKAVLFSLGYAESDLILSIIKDFYSLELFDKTPAKFVRLKRLFIRLSLPDVKITTHHLAAKDWLTRWKNQWKPTALTKKMDVVPVWHRNKYKTRRDRDYILIDTLMSFGTGLHETTQLMARFIEDNRGKFVSFLDIGTGTGILAFVALKYGARDAVGIDIGQLSVQAARDNMKVNKTYFRVVKADIKKYRSSKTYDFVAANLVTEDLIEHASKIISFVKEGGLLAVSGISLDNLSRLRRAFSSLPLKCLKISKGRQWSGLLYQKMML